MTKRELELVALCRLWQKRLIWRVLAEKNYTLWKLHETGIQRTAEALVALARGER